MANIIDFALGGGFDANGVMNYLTENQALANAIKIWLITPRGDVIRSGDKGGTVYSYLNVPLSPDNAQSLREEIISGLQYDFYPPLTTKYLNVVADNIKRAWVISGAFYCETYNLQAKLDVTIRT
jgi:phage baseplate assembly protein W